MNTQVRDAIKSTKNRIEMLRLSIKLQREYADTAIIEERLAKQREELAKVQREIAALQSKHYQAPAKIVEYQQALKYEKRNLTLLLNAKLIERLKKVNQTLKEMTDAKEHQDRA